MTREIKAPRLDAGKPPNWSSARNRIPWGLVVPPLVVTHAAAIAVGGGVVEWLERLGDLENWGGILFVGFIWSIVAFASVHAALATTNETWWIGVAAGAATFANIIFWIALVGIPSNDFWPIWIGHLLFAALVYLPGVVFLDVFRVGGVRRLTLSRMLAGTLLVAVLAALLRSAPDEQLQKFLYVFTPSAVVAWLTYAATSAKRRAVARIGLILGVVACSAMSNAIDQAWPYTLALFAGQSLSLWMLLDWRERMIAALVEKRAPVHDPTDALVRPLAYGEPNDSTIPAPSVVQPPATNRDPSSLVAKLVLVGLILAAAANEFVRGSPDSVHAVAWAVAAGVVALAAMWSGATTAGVALRTAIPCAAVLAAGAAPGWLSGYPEYLPADASLAGMLALAVFGPLFLHERIAGAERGRNLSISHFIVGTMAAAGLMAIGRFALDGESLTAALLVCVGPLAALAFVALAVAKQRASGSASPPLLAIAATIHAFTIAATLSGPAASAIYAPTTPIAFAVVVGLGLLQADYRRAVVNQAIIATPRGESDAPAAAEPWNR